MDEKTTHFLDAVIKVASLIGFIFGLLFFNDASAATALR